MLTLLSVFNLLILYGTESSAISTIIINATVGDQVLFPLPIHCGSQYEVEFLLKLPINAKLASWSNGTSHKHALYEKRLQIHQNGSLALQKVQINDTGLYEIHINYCDTPMMETTITKFDLQVFEPVSKPLITINCSTENASLGCSVSKGTNVALYWEIQPKSGPSNRIDGEAELVISHGHEQDKYTCVVQNPISNATSDQQTLEMCNDQSSKGLVLFTYISTATILLFGLAIIIFIYIAKLTTRDKGNNTAIEKWNEETCYLSDGAIEATYITRIRSS
ncbi:hepatic and glial cell adhesion molecule-like [Hemiscyllium ocellatum]|uniref:hepatic and glial cell adhesion molecule-like n=1 Tax=Hemiscyllium ocellatum TaxID=170820 RepID=UPI0029662164|nr:hepatic and glial cell adhesion molecule-like [Hemiscyllium ocellatum]